MVRLKHRYLLLEILYPNDHLPAQSATKTKTKPPPKPKSDSPPQTGLPLQPPTTPQQPPPSQQPPPPQPPSPSPSLLLPLPPVVQFHQPTSDDLTPQILARIIKDQIALLYGDYGVGVTAGSLNVKYLSPATSTAIIRCSRTHYRLVWAALSFLTHLPIPSSSLSKQSTPMPRPCVFRVLRVSGTIRKVEEEAVRRARAFILRAKRESEEEGLAGLDAILG